MLAGKMMCTFNHVGMAVPECDAAVEWYTRTLGLHQLGSTRYVPGEYIPPTSMFRRSGKPLEAIKVAFLLGSGGVGLELVEFIRGSEAGNEPSSPHFSGDLYHVALTVEDPGGVAEAIAGSGGTKIGEVAKMPSGVSFVHCLDPWGNALELMSGTLEQLVGA